MSDQLLRAHEIRAFLYNVADVAYPVSIRDQMNRARWIVEKARALGFFGPTRDAKYRKLLVCGAGAAGVTAALHAHSLGVETVLVEKAHLPFQRQRRCLSRWLDPTQYDWAADFWHFSHFPYPPSPSMPLSWDADRSSRLVLGWLPRLRGVLGTPGFQFLRPDHVVGLPIFHTTAAGDVLGFDIKFNSGKSDTFGMMLWCIGFGEERRKVNHNYCGFAFWDTDPFELPHWGVPNPPDDLRALISGAGDGALQDVIRLATRRKSALDVFDHLLNSGWSMPDNARHDLMTAEDQAQRALLWCRPQSLDEHNALQKLHDHYVQAVDYATGPDGPDRTMLIRAVVELLSANPHPVLLIHPCTHFARCYGLNHFLVLLLARVAALAGIPAPIISAQHGVVEVTGHACANDPWACHGQHHDVQLEQRPACYQKIALPAGTESAHVIVIRHGIAPNPAFIDTPLDFARQIMPYHLP